MPDETSPDEQSVVEGTNPTGTSDDRSALREFARRLNISGERRARLNRLALIAWLTALVVFVTWVILQGRDEFVSTFDEIASADLRWIAVAIVIQLFMLLFSAMTYQVILRRLGHRLSTVSMSNAHLQRTAISTVTPGGGPASVYIFVRFCMKQGVPASDGFLTIGVRSVAVWLTFVAVLVPGAAYDRSLAGAAIATAGVIVILIGTFALVKGERDNWETPLVWSSKLPAWAASRIAEFIVRFRDHGLRPADLLAPTVLALLVRLTIVGVLWACLGALDETVSLQTMLATYFGAIVASAAIPFLGGAGAVEAVAILTLTRAGVSSDIAIGATLLWRLIDLWIPAGIGLLFHARQELPALGTSNDLESNASPSATRSSQAT
jgi:phosphatidylglycerol lysyltransferase